MSYLLLLYLGEVKVIGYNTILNLPLGMIVAFSKQLFEQFIFRKQGIIISLVLFLLTYKYNSLQILNSCVFSILAVWFMSHIHVSSSFLTFVGVNSLAFYFLQTQIDYTIFFQAIVGDLFLI